MVESVTGATTIACGLNTAQGFLKSIGVLESTPAELKEALHEIKAWKRGSAWRQRQVARLLGAVLAEQGKFETTDIERTLGYEFKDKVWLLEALTHKSYLDTGQGFLPEEQASHSLIEEPTIDE